ncbi:MAG: L,D-transpeptidase, partial [Desulfobaccales bacterium]
MKAMLLLSKAFIAVLLWSLSVQAQIIDEDNPIYKDLAKQGRMATGQVTFVYGVPCVEVQLRDGETIRSFVYSIPSLKKKPVEVQDRIALVNKTHYLLVMNGPGNMSTDRNRIFVPLDYSIEPKILPEYLSGAANNEKYILIDRRQQYLGLYEWGNLKHVFPISTGKATPLK